MDKNEELRRLFQAMGLPIPPELKGEKDDIENVAGVRVGHHRMADKDAPASVKKLNDKLENEFPGYHGCVIGPYPTSVVSRLGRVFEAIPMVKHVFIDVDAKIPENTFILAVFNPEFVQADNIAKELGHFLVMIMTYTMLNWEITPKEIKAQDTWQKRFGNEGAFSFDLKTNELLKAANSARIEWRKLKQQKAPEGAIEDAKMECLRLKDRYDEFKAKGIPTKKNVVDDLLDNLFNKNDDEDEDN